MKVVIVGSEDNVTGVLEFFHRPHLTKYTHPPYTHIRIRFSIFEFDFQN